MGFLDQWLFGGAFDGRAQPIFRKIPMIEFLWSRVKMRLLLRSLYLMEVK